MGQHSTMAGGKQREIGTGLRARPNPQSVSRRLYVGHVNKFVAQKTKLAAGSRCCKGGQGGRHAAPRRRETQKTRADFLKKRPRIRLFCTRPRSTSTGSGRSSSPTPCPMLQEDLTTGRDKIEA